MLVFIIILLVQIETWATRGDVFEDLITVYRQQALNLTRQVAGFATSSQGAYGLQ